MDPADRSKTSIACETSTRREAMTTESVKKAEDYIKEHPDITVAALLKLGFEIADLQELHRDRKIEIFVMGKP
jgi:hypothetical protein